MPASEPWPAPGKPWVANFPTPNPDDFLVWILKDSKAPNWELPEKGAEHPDSQKYPHFKFSKAIPDAESGTGWYRLVYVKDRTDEDDYNFSVEYPYGDDDYPVTVRTYVVPREEWEEAVVEFLTEFTEFGAKLVDQKVTRFEGDPILDSLYVMVQKGYEILPGVEIHKSSLDETGAAVTTYQQRVVIGDTVLGEEGATKNSQTIIDSSLEPSGAAVGTLVTAAITLPGPWQESSRLDDDGVVVAISTRSNLLSLITEGETLDAGVWTKTTSKARTEHVALEIKEVRTIPGNTITEKIVDERDGNTRTVTRTMTATADITASETGNSTSWTSTEAKAITELVSWKVVTTQALPGNTLSGKEYDPRTGVSVDFTDTIRGSSVSADPNTKVVPIGKTKSLHHTVTPPTTALDAIVIYAPGTENLDLPDVLTGIEVFFNNNHGDGLHISDGAGVSAGTSGSLTLALNSRAQSSASLLADVQPIIRETYGRNTPVMNYYFYAAESFTLAALLARLHTITGRTVLSWPRFKPVSVVLTVKGQQASVAANADVQQHASFSESNVTYTWGTGAGSSRDFGASIKTVTIRPTLHDTITLSGGTSQSQLVTAACASSLSGGANFPAKTSPSTPAYATVTASVEPATPIPATTITAIPTSGLYLYDAKVSPHAEWQRSFVHAIVVDFSVFA